MKKIIVWGVPLLCVPSIAVFAQNVITTGVVDIFQKQSIVSSEFKKAEDFFEEGKRLYNEKSYGFAIKMFQKALALDLTHTTAQKYIQLCEQNIAWQEQESLALLDIKRKEEELNRHKKLESWLESGIHHYKLKKYDLALIEFEKVLKFKPNHTVAKKYIDETKRKLNVLGLQQISEISKRERLDQMIAKEKKIEQLGQRGIDLVKQRQFELALNTFKDLVMLDPHNTWAQEYIDLCEQCLDWETKEKKMQLELDRKYVLNEERQRTELLQKAQAFFEEGKGAFKEKRYQEALELFQKSLDFNVEHELAHNYHKLTSKIIEEKHLSDLRYFNQVKESATREIHLDQMMQTHLENEKMLERGQKLFNEQKFYPALEFFRNVAKRYSENKMVHDYIRLCEKSIEYNRKKIKAQADMAQVLLRYKNIEYNLNQGKMMHEQGKYEVSTELMKKVLQDVPNHALALKCIELNYKCLELDKEREKVQLEQKEWMLQEKEKMLEDQKNSGFIEQNISKGMAFFESKQYHLASQRFEVVLSKVPDHRVAQEYFKLCERYLVIKENKHLEKIAQVKNSLEQKSLAYFNDGKELFAQNKYREAIQKFSKAWELSPDAAIMTELQTYVEKSFKQLELMKQRKKKVENEKKQRQYTDLYRQGVVLFETKNYQGAIAYFRKALALSPKMKDGALKGYIEKSYKGIDEEKKHEQRKKLAIKYRQGMDSYRSEKWEDALKYFSEVHIVDPKFEDVRLYLKLAQKQIEASQE